MWLYGALPLAASQVRSVALGGSAVTCQQGSLTPNRSVPLTTSAVTCSAGTLVANHTNVLDPNLAPIFAYIVSEYGNVFGTQTSGTAGLFTSVSTSSPGSVGLNHSQALTTSAITSAAGTVSPRHTITQLTVMAPITSATGTTVYVVTGTGDVTVDLNAGEVEITAFTGTILPKVPLTGTASTSGIGSFGVSNSPTGLPTGVEATFGTGTMGANQDVEDTYIHSGSGAIEYIRAFVLTGTEMTGSQGTIIGSSNVTEALTGEEDLAEAGDVGFEIGIELTGAESIGEQYFVGAPGFGFPEGIECLVETGIVRDHQGNDRDEPLLTSFITATSDWAFKVDTLVPLFNSLIISEQFLFGAEAALEGQEILCEQGFLNREKRETGAGHGHGPHGKGKKRKKVTIDGQTFEVDEDELKDLVRVVEEVATAKAKEEAEELLAKAKADKTVEKIRLKAPKVSGSEELKDKLADIYAQAAIDAQVALEVSRNRQLDEEEAIVLLLVN